MKPTVQVPDFYQMGNDYAQAPLSSYYDMEKWNAETLASAFPGIDASALSSKIGDLRYYQDGIFTKLSTAISGWKDEKGFNTRRVYVGNDNEALSAGELFDTPKTNPLEPAVDSEVYGAGDIVEHKGAEA